MARLILSRLILSYAGGARRFVHRVLPDSVALLAG